MFFLIVYCATAASASSEMSYTNWPSVTPWKDLTNHIAWCYSALSERLAIVNRASETNDIIPSYTWPVSDYLRFAKKIDSIAPLFADQTKDQNDHFKVYLTTPIIEGWRYSYPSKLPRWSVTNLHKRAFSQEHWSTNSPLRSWLGMTNHAIQVEVQNAVTTLVWTAVESTDRESHKYYQCSQFNKTKTEPCYCDGEDYPAGYTNSAAWAKTYEQNHWNGGKIVDGQMGWGNPIYAVGAMLWVTEANYYNERSYTSYGARIFAKPVLYNVCTSFVARASVYLAMRHYRFSNYETYQNNWYTWDYKSTWLSNSHVQTNHLVFSQEFDPPRANKFVGDYPFYDQRNVNPVTGSDHMLSATEKTCDHIYCDTADWLLKWNVPGGLSTKPPPPIGEGGKVAENPDVDRDDLVEIAADMRSLGTDSGSITLIPECDAPVTLLPLAATPAWFGSLPVHAYFSQGAFTNLPYQVHVDPNVDDDGYYTAYSLNTRIEESGAINTPKVCQKRVELVRPRGNAVIFDFKWDANAFSDKGFPVGVNKNRSYVLRDMTPETHEDKKYELYFASGIVHEFDVNGALAAVRHADGRRVVVTRDAFPSATILRGEGEDGPGWAYDLRYGVTITWERGTLKKVEYKTKRAPEETITTELALDDRKFIQSLTKSGCGGVFSKSDAAISDTSVTYGSGVKVTRNATAAAGAARTVTLETSLPNVGKNTRITEFDVSDKVVRAERSGAGERAVTRYEYVGLATETRYPNGFPKQAKLKQIVHANGAQEAFEYSAQEGWLITRTLPSGAGFDRVTAYSYDNFKVGDAANPTNVVERPRKVEEKIGTTVIGRTLCSYLGAAQTIAQVCENASAAWNDPKNLKSTQNFGAGTLTAGLPVSFLNPVSADNSSYNYEALADGKLKTTATCSDGRVVTTTLNAFGASESSEVKENGQTVSSSSSTVDSFGRPLKTSFLDGTEVVNSDYGLYGPATVKGADGSTSTFQYFDHGALKQTVNNSTAITTTYEYDPLGHTIKTTITGGGQTSKTEATYDSLGRITSSKDVLNGTTRNGYVKTSSGITQTTTPPSGGTIVEERCFDGSVKKVYGSAAPASLVYDYGVENGVVYSTVKNAERPGEATTTYYNFIGNPTRKKRTGTAGETVYRYDSCGRPIGSTDEEQISQINTYNSKNQLEHSGTDFNRDGQANLTGSDPLNTQVQSVSGLGVKYETKTYQNSGNATATSLFSSETALNGKSGTFSQANRSGSFSRSNYAPQGTYSVTTQNSDGTTTVSAYEKWRLVSEQTTGAHATTQKSEYEYDGLGRLERVKAYRNGIGQATTYVRDSKGRITAVTHPDPTMGIQSVTYFGNTERISRIVKADGTSIAYFYDGAGRLTREFDMGAYDKHYDYDTLGRMIRLTTYGGGTPQITEWHYDAVTGLLHDKTIGGVTVATYHYRDNGQVSSVTDANNVVSTIGYDNAGSMTGITASDGSAISSVLGRTGRAESVASVGGPSLAYSNFTADDIPLTETISGNSVISNAVITHTYASSTHNGILSFNSVVTGGPVNGYSVNYASAARVSSITSSPISAACATYLYCGDMPLATSLFVRVAGRLLTKTVQWDYANARPLSVAYSLSGIGGLASYDYQYAPNSDRISKITLEDSTIRTYEYDSKGQLLASESFLADGVTPIPGTQYGWAYDGIGNVIKAGPSDEAGVPRYSFICDDRNVHISRAWGSSFEISGTAVVDATIKVGDRIAQRLGERFFAVVTVDNEASAHRTNIVVTAFRHDPLLNKDIVACTTGVLFVAKASETPAYDNNASMVTDSRFTYSWDAFGRLTGAVNEVVPKTRLAFAYYPDGRRARKTVYRLSGQNWLPVRNHQFFYDGWNLASEIGDAYDAAGNLLPGARVVRRCLWGLDLAGQRSGSLGQEAGGIGGLLAFTVTSNNVEKVYLPIADAMGNIHKIVDATTGAVAAEYDYDPFGKLISEAFPHSSIPEFAHFPFRFQSKYYDAETGLYYFGYRYYDPTSCKWLCRDPLQEQGGINLTAYCSNDPVNKVDPLGLAGYFFGGTSNCLEDEGISNVEIMYKAWNEDINGNAHYVPGVFSGYNPDGTKEKSAWAPSAGWLISPLGTIGCKGISHGLEGACGKTIDARVDEMMRKLEIELKRGDKVVNVFGFSRGATSALVFLNRIQDEIKKRNLLYFGISINFVALWDTVKTTAVDYRAELPKGMNFDYQPLHFIAIDEQRRAFYDAEVLDVQGAVQIGLRGVHADVGNGYRNNSFGMVSLWTARGFAVKAGLRFDEKTIDAYQGKFSWRSKPTNNSKIYYAPGLRFFPGDMYIHPSVKQFNKYSAPLNNIDHFDEMTDDIVQEWEMKLRL
jgi:RHS repeat-associated protein